MQGAAGDHVVLRILMRVGVPTRIAHPSVSRAFVEHVAGILATRGKYEDAEVFLKEALDLMPHDVEMWLLLVRSSRRGVTAALAAVTAIGDWLLPASRPALQALFYPMMGRGRDARVALKRATEVRWRRDSRWWRD